MSRAGRRLLERFVDAAMDQPQPTSELRAALRDYEEGTCNPTQLAGPRTTQMVDRRIEKLAKREMAVAAREQHLGERETSFRRYVERMSIHFGVEEAAS